MDSAPNFYDKDMRFSACAWAPNEVAITLPSDIWVTADQAEAAGRALVALAEWVRAHPSPEDEGYPK